MIKKIVLILYFTVFAVHLFGFEWPLEKKVLLTTFGQTCGEQFSAGISIGSDDQEVYPVMDGEVCFYSDKKGSAHSIPSGLGNYLVLEHQGGLRSVYSHLREFPGFSVKDIVHQGSGIGYTGISGASLVQNVLLVIIDTEYSQMMNPLLLLPPLSDMNSPVIQSVYAKRDEELIELKPVNNFPPGKIQIVCNVYDPGENVKYFNPMAPFEVLLSVNGIEEKRLIFEGLEQNNHEISLINSDEVHSSELYLKENLMVLGDITLSPGNNRIEITASDFIGNETNKLISITVTE